MKSILFHHLIFLGCLAVISALAIKPKQTRSVLENDAKNTEDFFRQKRNLAQFGKMIKCATGRSAWDYNGYGCYCGKGGTGTPVDGLDRCCYDHDKCYERIQDQNLCSSPSDVYWEVYDREGCTGCASSNDACELAICTCDSVAAKCFARNWFNPAYEDYPQSKC